MKFRISPGWWPVMAAASPVLTPYLIHQARRFYEGRRKAAAINEERISRAKEIDMPEIEHLEITVVLDHRHEEGFLGDAGVSYLLKSEKGSVLMDVGFGPERPSMRHNLKRLKTDAKDLDALFISHLHPDHMGGLAAARRKSVLLPEGFQPRPDLPCFVPAACAAPGMKPILVDAPAMLPGGLASTGPLSRMLCFTGLTEEHAIIANLKGKGLFVLTGCGHQTIETLIALVRKLSPLPIHTFAGGLHFPITESRGSFRGIHFQQIFGTGKVWWERITDKDLDTAIQALNASGIKRLLLSAHDSCDHALLRLSREVNAKTDVFRAGACTEM